jgi:hypothetical protein
MIKHLRPAIMLNVLMTALTGLAYPLAMAGLAGRLFPYSWAALRHHGHRSKRFDQDRAGAL